MRFISCKLEDLRKMVLPIGYEGENDHTRVQVDAGEVFKEYPAAVPSLKVHGPGGTIYPAEVTRDGKNVIWDIKASDCAADGSGEAQFTFTLNNVIVKSCIAKIKVYRSIVGGSTPPDPVQDWLDEAQDVLDDLEAAEVHQPMIGVDGYWYTWDQENEEYTKTETKAQGEDGQPGPAGQDGAPGQDATPALITVNYSDLTFPVAKDTQCYHDGLLYYAKQDIQTSEAWTAAHWQQTTVEEQQRLLKTAIEGIDDDIDDIKDVLDIQPPGTVNLFDVNNPNTTNLVPKTDGSGQITTSNGVYSVLLQVEPNSTVTLTKTDGNRCQILSFNSQPAKNDYWVQNVMSPAGNVGLTVTITTGATDVYLLCYLATSTSSCDYNSLKIFYGTEWHDSTPNKIQVLDAKLFNMLPDTNVFNLVSKRYIGSLTKPYIAISCDDGAADLATTTIPLFKGYKTTYNKNIPLTMGLMDTSAVLGNASYTTLVNEMLTDYGCEIATHGGSSYTSYSDADLIDFLNTQQTFIYGKCGRNPVGIIYPNHAYDLHKSVIAGSYYGVAAAGYSNGVKYQQCNGERSNMYELHRWSLFVSSQTTATIETVVDYCYDNNLLLLPWFHDNALTGADAENNIALLNHLVAYGQSKGIDFVSFKDIPNLI